MSIASWMSPPASALTFPISRVIRSESAGLSRLSSSAKRKRMLPRSGAGTRRQSSQAARAVATARPTSSAPERGNDSITSPVDGFSESKVLAAMRPIVVDDALQAGTSFRCAELRSGLRRVDIRERPGNARAAAVADRSPLLHLGRRLVLPSVRSLSPFEDDGDVRVALVVLDHSVEQLCLELGRDHA